MTAAEKLARLANVIDIVSDTHGRDHLLITCRVGIQSDYWLRKPPGEGVAFTATTAEDRLGVYLANERPTGQEDVYHEQVGYDRCSVLIDGNSVPTASGINYVTRIHGTGTDVIGAFIETPGTVPPGAHGAVNKQLLLVERDEAASNKVGRLVILGPDGTIATAGTLPVPQPWPSGE
jgi:hypothetical protein